MLGLASLCSIRFVALLASPSIHRCLALATHLPFALLPPSSPQQHARHAPRRRHHPPAPSAPSATLAARPRCARPRNLADLRYLLNNLDWLEEELGAYEDEYLILDMPGQIELYTHIPLLPQLATFLSRRLNFRTSAVYLLESQFMQDKAKFFAGVLSAMSCMLSLGLPMLCLMSKMDLVKDSKGRTRREVGRYLDPDPGLIEEEDGRGNEKFEGLNRAVVGLIEEQNIVSFLPLDVTDEDSVNTVLSHVDNMMQYGEDEEPKVPKDLDEGESSAERTPERSDGVARWLGRWRAAIACGRRVREGDADSRRLRRLAASTSPSAPRSRDSVRPRATSSHSSPPTHRDTYQHA